jgi:hypothetical protein
VATTLGATGIHDSRIRLLNRLWLQIAFDDLVVLALVVELVLGPQSFDDVEPFLRHVIAFVMRAHFGAEHVDFRLIPASDDIEDVPAVGNVIDRGALLRCGDRMVDRAV